MKCRCTRGLRFGVGPATDPTVYLERLIDEVVHRRALRPGRARRSPRAGCWRCVELMLAVGLVAVEGRGLQGRLPTQRGPSNFEPPRVYWRLRCFGFQIDYSVV